MTIFTYRSDRQESNEAQIMKSGLDGPSCIIEWADGLPSGVTISAVVTVALDSTGATVTTNCVSTTTNSGSQTTLVLKTCGAGGTAAAPDGSRFRLRTTATLSAGGPLIYDVFVYVRNKTYAPS